MKSRPVSTPRNMRPTGTSSCSRDAIRGAASTAAPPFCHAVQMSLRRYPLDALLAPHSIDFVGASARPNTPGHDMMRMIRAGGYRGTVFAVNPNNTEIDGFACVPDMRRLPAPPDLAVLAVKNERLEDI